ncbi:PREDICTED: uncharacterized protein LOC103925393 [Pygoscelis adeliae]|uniref:uncharacterized protein LOC103925393 n=1 Tax=Pygoscelis adeliae TaxID=9238 RepID=UPI0004F4DF3B|nr:PREDICTED: uncharacterized protein LOC103925393 [Pygoscelis adeliae]
MGTLWHLQYTLILFCISVLNTTGIKQIPTGGLRTWDPETAYLTRCDFNNNSRPFCDWTQPCNVNQGIWIRTKHDTPTDGTGPGGDYPDGKGYFIYQEASNLIPFDTNRLESPDTVVSEKICIDFWYYMFGSEDMNELRVLIQDVTGESVVWIRKGNQSSMWNYGAITHTFPTQRKIKVIFEAVRGLTEYGDTALDNVRVRDGPCEAICSIHGDPHYHTFDKQLHHFMGTCTYTLSKLCESNSSLPYFNVEAANEHRGSNTRVSYVQYVNIDVYGYRINLGKNRVVKVDGVSQVLPLTLARGVSISFSGQYVVVTTDFGLNVKFDGNHRAEITLPSTYMSKVCGICGNYNGYKADDFLNPDGEMETNSANLGNSWQVYNDSRCLPDDGHAPNCTADEKHMIQSNEYCGLITDPNGPFQNCHSVVDPRSYSEACQYDLCELHLNNAVLCQNLQAYADMCQAAGVQLTPWRNATFCPLACPANSHYEPCAAACPATCVDPTAPYSCSLPCVEGCVCDSGYLLYNDRCVPSQQCGCWHNGQHYPVGSEFWTDNTCSSKCTCPTRGSKVQCSSASCPTGQYCGVQDGKPECLKQSYGICHVHGDPHYNTFDKVMHNFMGNCSPEQISSHQKQSLACPANSHYEPCAAACPATCVDPTAPYSCSLPCVEGCVCDSGYLLYNDRCVPSQQCGCWHNGQHYPVGSEFWTDNTCSSKCTCPTRGSKVQCSSASCPTGQYCGVQDGKPECLKQSYGICHIHGDPHYNTFDKVMHNFMGNCTYTLAKVCSNTTSLPYFNVEAKNEHRGSTRVSYVREVLVEVYGERIAIVKKKKSQVLVNNVRQTLPVSAAGGAITVSRSGRYIVLETDFNLRVSYDTDHSVEVKVPTTYFNLTCGMCGNFNNRREDDYMMPNGQQAADSNALGESWQVPDDDSSCGVPMPSPPCSAEEEKVYRSDHFCGMLTARPGAFERCHTVINPQSYFKTCLYDLCTLNGGQEVLCASLEAYADACQAAGVTLLPWRNATFCPVACPPNSHYNPCTNACPATCIDPLASKNCSRPCVEGCECNNGFVISGGQCVSMSNCGCLQNGKYYEKGEAFWQTDCAGQCICAGNGTVVCNSDTCEASEVCKVQNGLLGCYPLNPSTCHIFGDPHYITFDGRLYHFQGDCNYTVVETCTNSSERFSVTTRNEHRGNPHWTALNSVAVTLKNLHIVLKKNKEIYVNGVQVYLPVDLNHGARITIKGHYMVIDTSIGIQVKFDGDQELFILVDESLKGQLCGLCGTFNDNQLDDFLKPDKVLEQDPNKFGDSWLVKEDNRTGPFQVCHWHIPPQLYFESCVYDLCATEGNSDQFCKILEAYAAACELGGVNLGEWRKDTICVASTVCNMSCTFDVDFCEWKQATSDNFDWIRHKGPTPTPNTGPSHDHTTGEGYYIYLQGNKQEQSEVARLVSPVCHSEGPHCFRFWYHMYGVAEMMALRVYVVHNETSTLEWKDAGSKGDKWNLGEVTVHSRGNMQIVLEGMRGEDFHSDVALDDLSIEKGYCTVDSETQTPPSTIITTTSGVETTSAPIPCSETCVVEGDPHYHTFDKQLHHFMGTCTYTLSKLCESNSSLPYFNVEAANEHRGANTRVSYVRYVDVDVAGQRIRLGKGGVVTVNGVAEVLPCTPSTGVQVSSSGFYTVVTTDFGLRVKFDGNHRVEVTLLSTFGQKVCGMCGNYNGMAADDFLNPEGVLEPDSTSLGNSWQVSNDSSLPGVEGCVCDSGYLLYNDRCVPSQQCGCWHNGQHYPVGSEFWTDNTCSSKCTCPTRGSKVQCSSASCPTGQYCVVQDGKPECLKQSYGICHVHGDPHYNTFDKVMHNFMGNCTYTLAKVCSNTTSLPYFNVEAKNEHRGSTRVSYVREVLVEVYGERIAIVKKKKSQVLVNNVRQTLPVSAAGGAITVSRSGRYIVLETDFNLRVSYDTDHSVESYFKTCLYDLCTLNGGQEVLCASLEAYADACQAAGVTLLPWRNATFCPLLCPANSYYDPCMTGCPATCVDQQAPQNCSKPCMEGCACASGFLLSGDTCVPKAHCGCLFEGNYYSEGEYSVSENCTRQCRCEANGQMVCSPLSCGEDEVCKIQNGQRGCYTASTALCHIYGDPHYSTFDGKLHHFQGSCNYTVVTGCDNSSVGFSVTTRNEHRGSRSWTALNSVALSMEGLHIALRKNKAVYVSASFLHLGTTDALGTIKYHSVPKKSLIFPEPAGVLTEEHSEALSGADMAARTATDFRLVFLSFRCAMCRVAAVLINGALASLPASPAPGVTISMSGSYVRVSTKLGLQLQFNGDHELLVNVSEKHKGKLCGLCGTYTGSQQDDFMQSNGVVVPNFNDFGASWMVPDAEWPCDPAIRPPASCSEEEEEAANKQCAILTQLGGPFQLCHAVLSPETYFESCVYDQCATGGSTEQLCNDLGAYASACAEAGIALGDWSAGTVCDNCSFACTFDNDFCEWVLADYRSIDTKTHDPLARHYNTASTHAVTTNTHTELRSIDTKTHDPLARHYNTASTHAVTTNTHTELRSIDTKTHDPLARHYNTASTHAVTTNTHTELRYCHVPFPSSTACAPTDNCSFACTFDNDFCEWVLADYSSIDWIRNKGPTPTQNTGPSSDHTTGDGYYIYLQGSNALPGFVAHLLSPVCSLQGPHCFRFWYHMYGVAETMALRVYVDKGEDLVLVWSSTGNHGDKWNLGEITLHGTGDMQIVLEGEWGEDVRSDVALDDLSIEKGSCKDGYYIYLQGSNALPGFVAHLLSPVCSLQGPHCFRFWYHMYGVAETMALRVYVDKGEDLVLVWSSTGNHGDKWNLGEITLHGTGDMQIVLEGEWGEDVRSDVALDDLSIEKGSCKGRASCSASGDPHYNTFDHRVHNFMGNCTYTLSKVCNVSETLPYFDVSTTNEHRGANTKVSYVKSVQVEVYGNQISLLKKKKVNVNGSRMNLPVFIEKKISIQSSGGYVLLVTDFGLWVRYDGNHYAEVSVPSNYRGLLCGLCGNYNGDPNDDNIKPNGDIASGSTDLGQSWLVPENNTICSGGTEQQCDPVLESEAKKNTACGMITDPTGIFKDCHTKVPPANFFENCVYDMCFTGGQATSLCYGLQAYAESCINAGICIAWRNATLCPMSCPGGSIYKTCGTRCPSTCFNMSAVDSCSSLPVEGCFCKEGYVLSGDKCVPESSCGCVDEKNQYHQLDESWFTSYPCTERCSCKANNTITCTSWECGVREECSIQDGVLGCHSNGKATCQVVGDPHYFTFDGMLYTFVGTCTYTLVEVVNTSSIIPITILGKNEDRGLRGATYLKEVYIDVYGVRITLQKSQGILLNNERAYTPVENRLQGVSIRNAGRFIVVETDFGVIVKYDGNHHLEITLPQSYFSKVHGMCGNFNDNREDDLSLPNGTLASVTQFGNSWKVEEDSDEGCLSDLREDDVPPCTAENKPVIESQCNVLKSDKFKACHNLVKPEDFVQICIYDMCQYDGMKSTLCDIVQVYVDNCKNHGITIKWRNSTFCPLPCLPHSHYTDCVSTCPSTCNDIFASSLCEKTEKCTEGCECDDNYVLSNGKCVPLSKCGCRDDDNNYYSAGETWITPHCTKRCQCQKNGVIKCESYSCHSKATCVIKNGKYKCNPTGFGKCRIMGDPHYVTFDGLVHHFQGKYTYILAQTIPDLPDTLTQFSIEGMNYPLRRSRRITYLKEILINVYNHTVRFRQNKQLVLDGVRVRPPARPHEGIHIYQTTRRICLETDFGLHLSFDSYQNADIKLANTYRNRVEGLCGDFDGKYRNDFTTPDGVWVKNVNVFGESWKVPLKRSNSRFRRGVNSKDESEEEPDPGLFQGCNKNQLEQEYGTSRCQILTDSNGPFVKCHSTVSPNFYFTYRKMELTQGQAEKQLKINNNKGISCPANSNYSSCMSACPASCNDLTSPSECTSPCVEGCECLPGYILSGFDCVPYKQCGCTYLNKYYEIGEIFTTDDCSQRCQCTESSTVFCSNIVCGSDETCGISNYSRGCYRSGPCMPSPCKNDGVCSETTKSTSLHFSCECSELYTGPSCEAEKIVEDPPTEDSEDHTIVIIVGVVAGVVIIIILITSTVYLCRRKRKTDTDAKSRDSSLTQSREVLDDRLREQDYGYVVNTAFDQNCSL